MSKAQARAQLLRQPGGSICSTVHIHNLNNLTPLALRTAMFNANSNVALYGGAVPRTGVLIVGDDQTQAKRTLKDRKALRLQGLRAKKVSRASNTASLWLVQRV